MKIGKYTLYEVNTGYFGLDGGAMFGIVPKPLWGITNPADEANRIKLATRSLLLVSDKKKVLVDTGMGNDWDDKARKIYNIQQDEFSIEKSLGKLNIKTEDITDVILTHLHFDHTGGSVKKDNDKFVPTFPNAKYYVQKKHYDWAVNPSEKDRGSYIKDKFVPLNENGVLNFLDEQDQFDDEIEFIIVNGHAPAQQLLKISDSSNTILFCGDLFPTSSHIKLPYMMGYDIQPLETIKEKKKILPKAIEENWKLYFEHDPYNVWGTVKQSERGYDINEKFSSL